MSNRADKKSRRAATARSSFDEESLEGSQVFYVYCIGERDEIAPLFEGKLPPSIEDASTVEAVMGGALAAVVSGVPSADYGEEALRARIGDPRWTAARVMRHEQVVEFFAARASVVPLRFGTIYLRRGRVEQMLAEREPELRNLIARLRGREEWGVNVFCERETLTEKIDSVSPRLRELAGQVAAASPGQAYLLRKKVDAMRADEIRAEIKRRASQIERALADACEGAVRLRVLKGETAEHGEVAAKLAFLVERERFDIFRAAAESLAAAHSELGFRMELTGPWPAYNFTSEEKQESGVRSQESE